MKLLITIFFIILIIGFESACLAKNKLFCSTQILANKTELGFTWTLVSRLSEILYNAEQRYGKRDPSWTLLGVEFSNLNQPEIWYPFIKDGRKHVIIQLTQEASIDEKEALFQLSHEVIHLLSPAGSEGTTVFEEGLATYFSIINMQAFNYKIDLNYIAEKKYKKAYQLIANLYKNFEQTEAKIQRLRQQADKISHITSQQFIKAFPGIDKKYATLLAKKYSKWTVK